MWDVLLMSHAAAAQVRHCVQHVWGDNVSTCRKVTALETTLWTAFKAAVVQINLFVSYQVVCAVHI